MINPLNPPQNITSTLCENRYSHLHSGVDFSTGQKNGLPVLAVMDGEAKQVKITYRGYGKCLYLFHKDGYITVYAHLSKFSPEIEEYLKPYYEKNLYPGTVEINPPIFYKKGDIIAYSGESGFGFPHLHFELRKGIETLNPVPYFNFSNSSEVFLKKIIVIPETPYTSINGKFKKVSFKLPLKDEIKVSGPFSIGIEAYDFHLGNKRGIQGFDLYLEGKLVSTLNFSGFSYDDYYGIRFILNYISFGNSIYNLNPPKNNPYNFFKGENYFDLKEGKYKFKVNVKGLSSKKSFEFFIKTSKPLPKPPILKENIFYKSHFFLSGMEGMFYPESIKLFKVGGIDYFIGNLKPEEKFKIGPFEIKHKEKFSVPFCFYLTKYENSLLEPKTLQLNMEPKDIGLTKRVEINVNLPELKEKEKVGIYKARGNLYYGNNWEGDKLKAEVFAPDDYVLLKDKISPEILKTYKQKNKIYVIARDIGSGIPWDGVQVKIDGKTYILEYDPDHFKAEGELKIKGMAEIIVKDGAGNERIKNFNF